MGFLGKDAQALNRQYSQKITALESEATQARQELQEAQRQLQDLERQEREISASDKTRAQECRQKIAAAQSKVQVCFLHNCYQILVKRIHLSPETIHDLFFSVSGSQSEAEGHGSSGKPAGSERA